MNNEEYLKIIENFKKDNKDDYESGKIRKVFLDRLPRNGKLFNWKESVDQIIFFIYQDMEGWLEIVEYIKDKIPKIKVIYNDNSKEFTIGIGDFKNAKIGFSIGKYNHDFLYNIEDVITVNTGNIKITKCFKKKDYDGYNRKWYGYECLNCGWSDGKIIESSLMQRNGCSACCPTPRKFIKEINSIWKTHSHLIKYFKNIEDSYTHTYASNDSTWVRCPDCGYEKEVVISDLAMKSFSCPKCGEGISMGEKFVFNILEQLDIEFEYHITFDWSKNIQVSNFKLCGNKEYDFAFVLNGEQYTIETHGKQHYEDTNIGKGMGRTHAEEVENDKIKKQLALENGIKDNNYIVIDCRYSNLNFIKKNILNSKLNELFDLSKIDYEECANFVLSNRIKEACDLWNSGIHSIKEISNIMKLSRKTIKDYLKITSKLKWSDYSVEYSKNENYKNSKIKHLNSKEVICVNNGLIYKSSAECARKFKELYDIELKSGSIQRVCREERNHHKGFKFKFTLNLTEEQIKEIQENAKLN